MGCTQSDPSAIESKALTKEINEDRKKDKSIKKLLFLGSGGSGKSTLFKQLRTLHGGGFGNDDRLSFIDHIHAQIIEQMKLAVEWIETLAEEALENDEEYDESKRPDNFNALGALSDDAQQAVATLLAAKDTRLNNRIAAAIKVLWAEPEIQKIYENRATMKIEDSSKHFWDKIEEIMAPGYIPTEDDILLVRYRTTGVIEQKFMIKKNTFHVFDVGGQKSERKKWIHCFEHVTAVIFVAALSSYDEVMFEDEQQNSMSDSLALFSNICNNTWFEKTSMILFLNKKDLFTVKLERVPITVCPDFAGYGGAPGSFDETTAFIKDMFVAKNKAPDEKSIFTHMTCATDVNNVEKVFNDVQHIIIENSLMSAGLMGDLGADEDDEEQFGRG